MKKLLFTALFSATALLNAQDKIIVEYRQVNEYDEEKQKQFNAELAQKGINIGSMEMPKIFYQLEVNQNLLNYDKIESVNNNQGAGGGGFSIHVGGEFKNTTSTITEQKFKQEVVLDGKKYTVVTPYKNYNWKITDIEDTILGYKVIKAVGEINGNKVAAWYAPDLPINAGPNQINGLPGLVLKSASEMGGKMGLIMNFTAEKINKNPKKFTKIKPFTSPEISQEEFKKLQDESRKKMLESFSGGVDIK
ncbi:GLPGLI family protein [Faecalibacter sp. LW9]|uniref:GLPGLI family protein n=1 Tax=Faecalibacter sp. LW9 TaxID=3103144 RepID=UPI002B0013DD|nr:GLPGLI family protein [Faecalibacter sp. LW9]